MLLSVTLKKSQAEIVQECFLITESLSFSELSTSSFDGLWNLISGELKGSTNIMTKWHVIIIFVMMQVPVIKNSIS